jgi:hypothetical protein
VVAVIGDIHIACAVLRNALRRVELRRCAHAILAARLLQQTGKD